MTPYRKHVVRWSRCKQCELSRQRIKVVLCRGMVPAPVLFVGEAPGQSEDVTGWPFDGPAGRLLDQIIDRSLDNQYDYALTNLVACFPKKRKRAGINEPSKEHIEACAPRLQEFISLCKPDLIVAVGKLAVKHLEGAAGCSIIHPAFIKRMDVSQKGLAVKRCIVAIEDAVARI